MATLGLTGELVRLATLGYSDFHNVWTFSVDEQELIKSTSEWKSRNRASLRCAYKVNISQEMTNGVPAYVQY